MPSCHLSHREIEVLTLYARDKSVTTQQIAETLGNTKRTIDILRQSIIWKLRVSNIEEAISIAKFAQDIFSAV